MSDSLERPVPAAWVIEEGTVNERRTGWLDLCSDAAVDMIHHAMKRPGSVTPTGLPSVDRNCFLWGDRKGIPQGSYVIVGGASNVGKTLFGLALLRRAAEARQKAGLISLDMKNRDAIARMLQGLGVMVPHGDWLPSRWTDLHREHLIGDVRSWRERQIMDDYDREYGKGGSMAIHTDRSRVLDDVLERVREGHAAGATFFVVDHLQKIRVPKLRGDVFATADYVAESFDDLVDELNVTVVGLSQLNRNASRETDRKPTMYDLHGGTSMESNAGIVLMLDHSRVAMDRDKHHLIRTWLILAKSQLGPKNIEVPILVNAANLSIDEALPDEEHKWPDPKKSRRNGSR